MEKSHFTETQIVAALKEADTGMKVTDVSRKHSFSETSYYKWKSKYGGLDASELERIRELEVENAKLKRMYAEMAMLNDALKELMEKSSDANRAT